MKRRFPILALAAFLALFSACHEWFELADEWDDDWDSWHNSSSDDGSYTTLRYAWRCPDTDPLVSGNVATAFDSVSVLDASSSEVHDGVIALYSWLLTGPDSDWKTQGVSFDMYEYFLLSLASGEIIVLRFLNQSPEEGGGSVTGDFFLIDAAHAQDAAMIESAFLDLDVAHSVRHVVAPEDLFGEIADTGDVSGTVTDEGSGAFRYDLSVMAASGDGVSATYAVSFMSRTQLQSVTVTMQNAYGRESYTVRNAATTDYTYAIYVEGEAQLTQIGEADTADFDDYCGPGPSVSDPVVFDAD